MKNDKHRSTPPARPKGLKIRTQLRAGIFGSLHTVSTRDGMGRIRL